MNQCPMTEIVSVPEASLNVRTHGAKGDGHTDDTAAIQAAIDAAGKCRGGVWFPPGVYNSSRLKLHTGVALTAVPTFGLKHEAGTTIRLIDENVPCLLDLNDCLSVRVRGLTLEGGNIGKGIAGIDLNGNKRRPEQPEDTPFLEDCCIRYFSGHGASLLHCWEFVIRNSQFTENGGHGLVFSHWDSFIFESMFSGNKGYGIAALRPNAAMTIQGNRIEWNELGGIYIERGGTCQISGNFIDRSGGPGLHIASVADPGYCGYTVTGNIFHRSGVLKSAGDLASAHIKLDGIAGLVCANNVFKANYDYDGATSGIMGPSYGIVYQDLRECIIKDNAMTKGATTELLKDCGGHDEATIVKDNVGSLYTV